VDATGKVWTGVQRRELTLASDEEQELKTCFVVMPITTPTAYVQESEDPEHFAHVLDHLFIPALESLGYQVILPSVTGSELIHAEIIKNLEQADLALCDLSSLNPNVFFELGIRTALDRPMVLVRDKLTLQIPFDLAAINVFTYDGSLQPWILKEEIPRLTAHIKASVKSGSGAGNAMWHYFGLTKRASPAEIAGDPQAAKVDLILAEMTKMQQREHLEDSRVGGFSANISQQEANSSRMVNLVRTRIARAAEREGILLMMHYSPDSHTLYLGTTDIPIPPELKDYISEVSDMSDIRIHIFPPIPSGNK
jgi:hypothetical protein